MNFLEFEMKKTPPTWSLQSLQIYRHSRGWPELSPEMAEKVVLAIHDIQDHYDGEVFSSSAEPAFLFQPMMQKVKDNG
jgi:hypothetical protein